ncbi:hypothetical protein [Streptomyces sp. NBC_00859]|uniref:hypothetical protein n=1 Tax=Streptomyces sp. NBC_00859 TaxID=2903682 RepID=UPI00386C8BF9|nr:hypothetical protein OG584_01930 [Streptomyces sp. NBC_00859]
MAISLIKMAAPDHDRAVWQRPSEGQLVQLGLDALLAGVESPSLVLLAGLVPGEYGEARELFDAALEELGLLPLLPEALAEARWTAALWWARRIVTADLDPVRGARLIWLEAAAELGYPDVLGRIVGLATAVEVQNDQFVVPQSMRDDIASAAQVLLNGVPHRTGGA